MVKYINKRFLATFLLLMFVFTLMLPKDVSAASNWTDLGSGYSARWDPPSAGDCDTGRYHVHVYKDKKDVGSERCGGGKSHGDEMNNVPNKVKEKVKGDKKWEQGAEKNKELDEAAKKINSDNLLSNAAGIVIAIGLVVLATGTFFFPGDDVAAWANLLRLIALA